MNKTNQKRNIPKSLIESSRSSMTKEEIYYEYVIPYKFIAEHRSPKIKVIKK